MDIESGSDQVQVSMETKLCIYNKCFKIKVVFIFQDSFYFSVFENISQTNRPLRFQLMVVIFFLLELLSQQITIIFIRIKKFVSFKHSSVFIRLIAKDIRLIPNPLVFSLDT